MALTLDDNQEAALRQWWSRYGDGTGYGQRTLHGAVAPLMKPWRASCGFLLGPGGVRYEVWNQSDTLPHAATDSAMARRICDLLNESEARR